MQAVISSLHSGLTRSALRAAHSIAAASIEGGVEVVIEDTGAGIPAEDLPHIFDRFRRGKTEKSGAGLGLAIVKQNTELYGGEILVESVLGKGTEFILTFPTRVLLQDNES